jgi:hypothetical protein
MTGAPADPVPATLAIVFAHPDGSLPNPWYRAYRKAKRALSRAGYDAQILLRPLSHLPERVDVLVVDPTFRAARGIAAEMLAVEANEVAGSLDRLLAAYEADGRLRHAPSAARALAVHVGFLPMHGRARAEE